MRTAVPRAAKSKRGVGTTRDGRRRSKTIARKELMREIIREREASKDISTDDFLDLKRPKTREDCLGGPRPCLFVSCKYHLYLDVNPETGSIKINFPDLEVWELDQTCALDVAERGGVTLEEVGQILNLTRERIRQVEVRGLAKIKYNSKHEELQDLFEEE